jgi:hypothetical protein
MRQKPSRAQREAFSPEIALQMLHLMFRKLEIAIIFCGVYRIFSYNTVATGKNQLS